MDKPKSSLFLPRQRLVELMQYINFGRIEGLVIKDGQPVFTPPPRIVREIKFGGKNGPNRETDIKDSALKSQVVELFACFDKLKDGVVELIEIKNGLPFRLAMEDAA